MARERWFYELDNERRGPFSMDTLVEALRTLPDPRSTLVWKHGMPVWTTSAEVPEIERQLPAPAPVVAPPAAYYPVAPPPGDGTLGTGSYGSATERDFGETRSEAGTEARYGGAAARPFEPQRRLNPMVYVGGTAAVLAVAGVAAWLLWFKPPPPGPTAPPGAATRPAPGGATTKAGPEGGRLSAEPAPTAEPPKAQGFTGWSDSELPLPASELAKLRGVAGWSGETLSITLYNGSTWRVTELLVKTGRLEGDTFVEAPSPALLLPVTEQIDSGVDKLLRRVAPDRRKPGTNPFDTGAFEGKVGPRPEAYQQKIVGAKGYPPRGES